MSAHTCDLEKRLETWLRHHLLPCLCLTRGFEAVLASLPGPVHVELAAVVLSLTGVEKTLPGSFGEVLMATVTILLPTARYAPSFKGLHTGEADPISYYVPSCPAFPSVSPSRCQQSVGEILVPILTLVPSPLACEWA
ncbi:hypothetical protein JB92DRAFT_2826081 [Gautieria morchelliformis]|nr:hypothetical protein JB92DRAFT_2826081 [Gautieria morchelliformis]